MIRNSTQHVCPDWLAWAMIAAMVALAATVFPALGRAEQAQPARNAPGQRPQTVAEILHDEKVVAAIRAAWRYSGNGTSRFEAGFRLDGSPSDYRVTAFRAGKDYMSIRFQVRPGTTFAVLHVHPTMGHPEPSQTDKGIADKYNFKVITVHLFGIYEYDPATKKTIRIGDPLELLRPRPEPAAAHTAAKSPE